MNVRLIFKVEKYLRSTISVLMFVGSLVILFSPNAPATFKLFEQSDYVRVLLGCSLSISSLLYFFARTKFIGSSGLILVFSYSIYMHFNVNRIPKSIFFFLILVLSLTAVSIYFSKTKTENETS
jgi:hypothetical protein